MSREFVDPIWGDRKKSHQSVDSSAEMGGPVYRNAAPLSSRGIRSRLGNFSDIDLFSRGPKDGGEDITSKRIARFFGLAVTGKWT